MMESYKVVLVNRSLCGIGEPCDDDRRVIGHIPALPATVAEAEDLAACFLIPVIRNSPHSYHDGWSVSVQVKPIPGRNFDEAWIEIYPE